MTFASSTPTLLQPEELQPAVELAAKALAQMDRVLLGRTQLHRMVLAGILSRGHILLEGLPGVGKTALIKALGQILRLEFRRVQFTPDLMPSDILGTHILRETSGGGREMTFQSGPIFTNILLADEINRASPKTQSALLEAMQERSVTLLGNTRMLPDPFFVLASQNPIELEGTYPLPEAQLDRFLFKLTVSDVSVEVLDGIISTRRRGEPPMPESPLSAEDLARLFGAMERIYLPRAVSRYIARVVAATHPDTPEASADVTNYVTYGASPRAAIAMAEASRAYALLNGRPSVGFEDVRAVAPAVLNHRLILNYKARFDKIGELAIVDSLLRTLDEAGLNLPADVRIETVGKERSA
ncbi:MAG: AAA family ATPase [Thermoguttaceae bacterium]